MTRFARWLRWHWIGSRLWRVGITTDSDGCKRRFGLWHVTYTLRCLSRELGWPDPADMAGEAV